MNFLPPFWGGFSKKKKKKKKKDPEVGAWLLASVLLIKWRDVMRRGNQAGDL